MRMSLEIMLSVPHLAHMSDLDSISDEIEREATVGIIHNCLYCFIFELWTHNLSNIVGQTPRKIFSTPHPPRLLHGIGTLPLGTLHGVEEDHHLLMQSLKPIRGIFLFRCGSVTG